MQPIYQQDIGVSGTIPWLSKRGEDESLTLDALYRPLTFSGDTRARGLYHTDCNWWPAEAERIAHPAANTQETGQSVSRFPFICHMR